MGAGDRTEKPTPRKLRTARKEGRIARTPDLGAWVALLTRIAPALNAFSLSFPLKILLTLSVVGLTFPLLPDAVRSISEVIAQSLVALKAG